MSKLRKLADDPAHNSVEMGEFIAQSEFNEDTSGLNDFFSRSLKFSEDFLEAIKDDSLSKTQKTCVLLLSKSKRLSLTIYKLASTGYWPEAEILFRAQLELQFILGYMVEDETEQRFEQWANREKPTEKWPVSEIMKDFPELKDAYTYLSLYPHSHPFSTSNHISRRGNDTTLEFGPMTGKENASKAQRVASSSAMTNASIIEIMTSKFSLSPDYDKNHIELMSLPHFQNVARETKPSLELNEKFQKKYYKK